MRNGKNAAAASAIKSASNALTAKKIGAENSGGPNWSTIRAERMKTILNLKFRQNQELQRKLIDTSPRLLIEATKDRFWGAGAEIDSTSIRDGSWSGLNTLGNLLCEVRDDLRRETQTNFSPGGGM